MLIVFGSLLFVIISFQVYRGIVAFRHPEREIVRPAKTSWVVWLLATLVVLVVLLAGAAIGARVYGP